MSILGMDKDDHHEFPNRAWLSDRTLFEMDSYESLLIHSLVKEVYAKKFNGKIEVGFASEDHEAIKKLMERLEDYIG